jgi:hypothetical protein
MLYLIAPLLIGVVGARSVDGAVPMLRNVALACAVIGVGGVAVAEAFGNVGAFYGGAVVIWIGVVMFGVYLFGVYRGDRGTL